MEQITATFYRTRYQKPPNPWGVFEFEKSGNPICVVGSLSNPEPNMEYIITGEWVKSEKYGKQFKAESFQVKPPTTRRGIIAVLCGKDIRGVGPILAAAIVDRFGLETLDVLRSEDYMKVTEVPGVGKTVAQRLHEALLKPNDKEALRMLLGNDVTDAFLERLLAQFDNPVEVIKKDPYILIEKMKGVGFLKADKIALSVGFAPDSLERICAAIYYFLSNEADFNGHCYSYCPNLESNLQDMIPSVSIEKIADAIKRMATTTAYKKMAVHVEEDGAVYLASLYNAEKTCAKFVRNAVDNPLYKFYTPAMLNNVANAIEREYGYRPEESQMQAVQLALNNRFSTITGGPGTGKTTTVRTILKALSLYEPTKKIALMAPTGRAAVRMKEVTGMDATTIHRRVFDRITGGPRKGAIISEDVVIVDEGSMIDISLAYALLSCLKEDARVIIIGDVDQLPPVGPGTFFRDLIASYRVPTARLKLSFRNSGFIAANAERFNLGSGVHSFSQDESFQVVPCTKMTGPQKAIHEYLSLVKEYGLNEVILLTPTRAHGNGGANALNNAIQDILNPAVEGQSTIETKTCCFRVGDRVMLQKNDWEKLLANGDTGTIQAIRKNQVCVLFDNGREEQFTPSSFSGSFALSYACTVHKSQGSEYKGVVFLFTTEHTFMGERNIVYTAETRAKEKIRLVCDARALNRAIDCVKPIMRNSKLKERINAL